MTFVEKKPPVPVDLLNLGFLDEDMKNAFTQNIAECTNRSSSMREQIYLIHLIDVNGRKLSSKEIGLLFGKERGTIISHIRRAEIEIQQGGPRPLGRPPILDDFLMCQLRKKVIDDYEDHILCTYNSLSDWLYNTYNVLILPDTLGAIIRRDQSIKPIQGRPIESLRLSSDPNLIDEYYHDLANMITDLPADLVANLDEMGYSDYADTSLVKMVVPSWVNDGVFPVERTKKRITILHCIFADGTFIKPLIIVPRKTIELELFDIGLTPDKVIVMFQENGFVDTHCFLTWASNVFFPEIANRLEKHRKIDHTFNRSAVLMLDGLKQHFCDYFEDECYAFNVDLAVIPPHTSDQIQPLDLLLFAIAKKNVSRIHPNKELSSQSQDILKVFSGMQSASTVINIVNSFRLAGVTVQYNGKELIAQVDIKEAKRVRHYQAVVEHDQHLRSYNKARIDLCTNQLDIVETDLFFRELCEDSS